MAMFHCVYRKSFSILLLHLPHDTFFILYPRLKESQPKRCPFVPETLGAFDRMFRAFVLVVRGTYPRCMGDLSSMYRASTYDI